MHFSKEVKFVDSESYPKNAVLAKQKVIQN